MAIHIDGLSCKDVYSVFSLSNYQSSVLTSKQAYPYVEQMPIHQIEDPKNIIEAIKHKDGFVWLNSKGEICYRLSKNGAIHTSIPSKASLVLSNFLKQDIYIKLGSATDSKITNEIATNDLLLVEGEKFNPCELSEFYHDNYNLVYRNTFRPTSYLRISRNDERIKPSIILQYIYYLANYRAQEFYYILNWLASFFKNPSQKSNICLVLFGKQESGKDIFFDEIIQPLFGSQYCIKISDNNLRTYNLFKIAKNKLFYNLDEISNSTIKNKKIKNFITDLMVNDIVSLEKNQESIDEIIFGQTLITINESNLQYTSNNYKNSTVFKVPDDLDNIYINDTLLLNNIGRSNFKKDDLIKIIRADLGNFSLILKAYATDINQANKVFENDDKECLQNSTEDKLMAFSNAIVNKNIKYFQKIQDMDNSFYQELMEDFEKKRIKQKNLTKYFNIIYEEEPILPSRTLMTKLRQIDKNFYKKEALQIGTAGVKYFPII